MYAFIRKTFYRALNMSAVALFILKIKRRKPSNVCPQVAHCLAPKDGPTTNRSSRQETEERCLHASPQRSSIAH